MADDKVSKEEIQKKLDQQKLENDARLGSRKAQEQLGWKSGDGGDTGQASGLDQLKAQTEAEDKLRAEAEAKAKADAEAQAAAEKAAAEKAAAEKAAADKAAADAKQQQKQQ